MTITTITSGLTTLPLREPIELSIWSSGGRWKCLHEDTGVCGVADTEEQAVADFHSEFVREWQLVEEGKGEDYTSLHPDEREMIEWLTDVEESR